MVNDFSAILNIKIDENPTNALIDTGASCSLIDVGSLRALGLNKNIEQSNHTLIDASDNTMDILRTLNVMICTQHNKPIHQNMKVLNNESCCNLILGRDFLPKFTTVDFDFPRLYIKLGANWHKCIQINQPTSVSLVHSATLPPRSKSIINVHCSKSISLITADFKSILFQGDKGVYATRCRIIPNIDGVFQISLLKH